ncbi:MAG: hypothetical protein RSA17_07075 [Ruthenibacterium sp.]
MPPFFTAAKPWCPAYIIGAAAHNSGEVKSMSEFANYTPEMLVYYHALPPALQAAVSDAQQQPCTMESLAALAEQLAQNGTAFLQ